MDARHANDARAMSARLARLRREVSAHYRDHRRDMPWRRDTSLYAIVVSEIMLQQTQVSRVIVKFQSWMKRFPDWAALAKVPIKDVLAEWSGLGYNRRALYMKQIADKMTSEPRLRFLNRQERKHPHEDVSFPALLQQLPGIGPNTAGSIMAFAFNIPQPFIETNIRSVFIHFCFSGDKNAERRLKVSDKELMPLIERALSDAMKAGPFKDNAREWHWALMDYGSHLKQGERSLKQGEKTAHRSAHHVRQTPFKGSNRELRSKILKIILEKPMDERAVIRRLPAHGSKQIATNIAALAREGFIAKKGDLLQIA